MTDLIFGSEDPANATDAGPRFQPDGARQQGLTSSLIFAIAGRLLRGISKGSLRLVLANGKSRTFTGPLDGVAAEIQIVSSKLLWLVLRRGSIGFAEAYLGRHWETPDLANVFRFFLDNADAMQGSGGTQFSAAPRDRAYHRARPNSKKGSQRNIAAHYDLGNAFYALWLDPGMSYSSGLFAEHAESLAAAQNRKYAMILEWLELRAGARVLEIGCGWGGFVEAAVKADAAVTGITISEAQLAFAKARAADQPNTDLRFQDYRDTAGTFDGIASIEMIEAVGEENWPRYFETLFQRLKPGASAVLQAITIPEHFFDHYRRNPDFIQRYIFPGGVLPTRQAIATEGQRAGLVLDRELQFSASYAETLWRWLANFRANWPAIEKLGFDERFRRMWEYYLIYCATGFEREVIEVGLYRLTKPVVEPITNL